MNIKTKIEEWLLNRFAGKIIARAAVTIAAYAAGPLVAIIAAKTGIHIPLDQAEIQASLILGAQAVFEWFKARRMKNSNSPAVQTDSRLLPAGSVPSPNAQ